MVYLLSEEEIDTYTEFNNIVDGSAHMDVEEQRILMEEMLIALKKRVRAEGDRRRLPRIKCDMAIDYIANTRTYRSRVTDINEDGLFIVTENGLTPGQPLRIIANRPMGSASIYFNGSVVRTGSNGFVTMFTNLNFYTDALIRAVVEKLRIAEARSIIADFEKGDL